MRASLASGFCGFALPSFVVLLFTWMTFGMLSDLAFGDTPAPAPSSIPASTSKKSHQKPHLKVVITLKPIHSLAASIMRGAGHPYLMIKGPASPHTYAMRPIDARALQQADLIVWVGANLETFLSPVLRAIDNKTTVLELAKVSGLRLLKSKTSPGASHGTSHQHSLGTSDSRASNDPHIWLDTRNAKAIAQALAETLAKADPARASLYTQNLHNLQTKIDHLATELASTLAPVRAKPFIVFHDAYGYFERQFGLNSVGIVSLGHGRLPGVRQVREIRARIFKRGITCVFSEPQFSPRLLGTILAGTQAKMAVLDPLGAALKPGPDLYAKLMRNLAASVSGCLAENP